jgi:5-methylcytosine-specific restriction protein A
VRISEKILACLEEGTIDLPSFNDCVLTDEAREGEASTLSDEELRRRAGDASRNPPERRLTTAYYYSRDGNVAAYVKRAAKGFCDLCQNRAPFEESDGVPYLECHHVEMLADGGTDTQDNTVALCPNCHRRVNLLKLAAENIRLKERIEERDK